MRTREALPAVALSFSLRVIRASATIAVALVTGLPVVGQEYAATYFPTFGAETPTSPGHDSGGHLFAEFWWSTAGVFNLSVSPQVVVAEEVLGDSLPPEALAKCFMGVAYPPGEGNLAPCQFRDAIRFVRLRHGPDVVVDAQLSRYRVAPCTTSPQHYLPQGFAPLPTYHRLFQPGERTLAGPVELRTQDFPPDCATGNQVYDRRVNVTLANYGQAPATFTIVAYRFRRYHSGYDPVWTTAVTVDARRVHQVNNLPIPRTLTEPGENHLLGSMSIWLTITSDQPYLGYVSSVFEGGEPGSLPFQVFPLRGAKTAPSSP